MSQSCDTPVPGIAYRNVYHSPAQSGDRSGRILHAVFPPLLSLVLPHQAWTGSLSAHALAGEVKQQHNTPEAGRNVASPGSDILSRSFLSGPAGSGGEKMMDKKRNYLFTGRHLAPWVPPPRCRGDGTEPQGNPSPRYTV